MPFYIEELDSTVFAESREDAILSEIEKCILNTSEFFDFDVVDAWNSVELCNCNNFEKAKRILSLFKKLEVVPFPRDALWFVGRLSDRNVDELMWRNFARPEDLFSQELLGDRLSKLESDLSVWYLEERLFLLESHSSIALLNELKFRNLGIRQFLKKHHVLEEERHCSTAQSAVGICNDMCFCNKPITLCILYCKNREHAERAIELGSKFTKSDLQVILRDSHIFAELIGLLAFEYRQMFTPLEMVISVIPCVLHPSDTAFYSLLLLEQFRLVPENDPEWRATVRSHQWTVEAKAVLFTMRWLMEADCEKDFHDCFFRQNIRWRKHTHFLCQQHVKDVVKTVLLCWRRLMPIPRDIRDLLLFLAFRDSKWEYMSSVSQMKVDETARKFMNFLLKPRRRY